MASDEHRSTANARRATHPILVGAAALAFVLLTLARPWLNGADAGAIARCWGFVALYVVLPGWLAWRALRARRDELVTQLGMGWALGQALQIVAYVLAQLAGWERGFVYWPLVCAPLAWAAQRKDRRLPAASSTSDGLDSRHLVALLALLALVVARAPVQAASSWWCAIDFDTLFHAGNSAALRAGLPYTDPRVAGLAYNYHYFGYAFAAGLRSVTGVPLVEVYERISSSAWPLLLTVQVFALARGVARATLERPGSGGSGGSGRENTVGLVAAALVVLHAEFGVHVARVVSGAARFDAQSYLEYGIYNSPSSVLGLVFFVSAAQLVVELLLAAQAQRASSRGPWLASIAFVAVAAGTKGTVVPILVGASVVCAVLAWWKHESARRALLVTAALALPAAPMTLLLSLGSDRLTDAVLRFAPWHGLYTSRLFATVASAMGTDALAAPRWLEWLLAPLWIALVLGPCCAGFLRWRAARDASVADRWLGAAVLAGLVATCVLGAQGLAQLFFGYTAHVALAVLAAQFFVLGSMPLAKRVAFACVLGILPALAVSVHVALNLRRDLRAKPVESALLRQYREGLEWIREATPLDAVVLSHPGMLLTSARAERRAFYETDSETPASFAISWEQVGGRWRKAVPARVAYSRRLELAQRFESSPSAAVLREARAELDPRTELFAIVDRLHLDRSGPLGTHWELESVGDRRLDDETAAELVFENEALRVYRLRP